MKYSQSNKQLVWRLIFLFSKLCKAKKQMVEEDKFLMGRTLEFLFEFVDEDVLNEDVLDVLPKELEQALEEVRKIIRILLAIAASSN